jgi:hypothetical protein
MPLLEEIQASLKEFSKIQNVNVEGEFATAMSIIEGRDLEDVEKRIEDAIERHIQQGEKIVSRLERGEIFDGGQVYFKITAGFVLEFYDYENMTSVFVRNYRISDLDKEWIAVYIDQNTRTPWWDRTSGG